VARAVASLLRRDFDRAAEYAVLREAALDDFPVRLLVRAWPASAGTALTLMSVRSAKGPIQKNGFLLTRAIPKKSGFEDRTKF
jgi:hypothetical protein